MATPAEPGGGASGGAITPTGGGASDGAAPKADAPAPKADAPAPTGAAPTSSKFNANKKEEKKVAAPEEKQEIKKPLENGLTDALMKFLLGIGIKAMHNQEKNRDKEAKAQEKAEAKAKAEGKPPPPRGMLGRLINAMKEALKDDKPGPQPAKPGDTASKPPRRDADEPVAPKPPGMESPVGGQTPLSGEGLGATGKGLDETLATGARAPVTASGGPDNIPSAGMK